MRASIRRAVRPALAQVYYADADGGPSPFTVQLDDFRMAGGTSRVCHLSTATRALDLASLVAREEGLERPPRLFLEGAELPPDALVCRIARPGSVVLLVPQLTELISFFVSKVALARPASPLVEAVTDAKVRRGWRRARTATVGPRAAATRSRASHCRVSPACGAARPVHTTHPPLIPRPPRQPTPSLLCARSRRPSPRTCSARSAHPWRAATA